MKRRRNRAAALTDSREVFFWATLADGSVVVLFAKRGDLGILPGNSQRTHNSGFDVS